MVQIVLTCLRRHIMKEQLTKLMEEYHASDLGELMDILPDLDLEDYEDELPQQKEVDLDKVVLAKEPADLMDDSSCPFIHSYFQSQLIK